MSDELGKSLLGQDGLQAGQVDAQTLGKLRQKVALGHKRLRRLRWILAISWAWAAIYIVVFRVALYVPEPGMSSLPPAPRPWQLAMLWLAMPGLVMVPVAVVSTVSYLIRSRELGMAEIQLRLAGLESFLRGSARKA